MEQERVAYLSYLLRLWQTRSGEKLVWRASLENARTGVRHSFADPIDALYFLDREMGRADPRQDMPGTDGDPADPGADLPGRALRSQVGDQVRVYGAELGDRRRS
jgi:hypothetical protein